MITLDDVSDYLEQVHKYSGYIMFICPEHDDHNPSARAWANGWKCLSCGAHGSLTSLYEKVSGRVVVREKYNNPSAKIWNRWLNIFGSVQVCAKVAHTNLSENPDLANYLVRRKIDTQIKTGMFGYLDGYYTFPIKDKYNQVQGLVVRTSPTIQTKRNRYSVSPNCPIKLYIPDWKKVDANESIYVVFGTIDAWSMDMAGYACVTGLSGQEFSATNLDIYRKPIYIIPDKGEERKSLELQSQLGWRGGSLFLDFPDGCKDVNNIHVKFGLDTVSRLIEKAKERYNYE